MRESAQATFTKLHKRIKRLHERIQTDETQSLILFNRPLDGLLLSEQGGDDKMSQEFKYRINLSTSLESSDESEAYISIKRRVSKIDRFALDYAIEVEEKVNTRLTNILKMFLDRSSKLVVEFSSKCKMGSQRHLHDRILNQSKNLTRRPQQSVKSKPHSYMNTGRLYYGEGAQLVHELLNQTLPCKLTKKRKTAHEICEKSPSGPLSEQFEPTMYAKKLEELMRDELGRSRLIMDKLDAIQENLKSLARNHRDQVDSVYSAVEERQASVVIRRSAYNLSLAANEATSTPITAGPIKVAVGHQ